MTDLVRAALMSLVPALAIVVLFVLALMWIRFKEVPAVKKDVIPVLDAVWEGMKAAPVLLYVAAVMLLLIWTVLGVLYLGLRKLIASW